MSLRRRLLLSLAVSLPACVHAADQPLLSREEVEQCVHDREDVVAANHALTARKAAIDARGDALLRNEARLKEARDSLKPDLAQLQEQEDELKRRGNDMAAYLQQATVVKTLNAAYKERVDRYNDEVRAHQVQLDQYNADAQALNQQLDQLDAKARATDKRCVRKPARRSDIDAAQDPEPATTVLKPETRVLP